MTEIDSLRERAKRHLSRKFTLISEFCNRHAKILEFSGYIVAGLAILFSYYGNFGYVKREIDLRQRDLSRSYYEKQLEVYLQASQLFFELSKPTSTEEKEKLENEFWKMYYVTLPFFGSKEANTLADGFCKSRFAIEKCESYKNSAYRDATTFSQDMRNEIQNRWLSPKFGER